MTKRSYNPNEDLHEGAINQIEEMMKNSKVVEPRIGFTTRWVKRYRKENVKLLRRQATIFVIINTAIAFSLLGVIGWIYFYGTNSFGSAVSKLVTQMGSTWADIRVFFHVFETVLKTIPGIIPSSLWIAIISLVGIVLLAWVSRIRKSFSMTGTRI